MVVGCCPFLNRKGFAMIIYRKKPAGFGVLLCTVLSVCMLCGDVQADSAIRIGGNGSGLGAMKLLAKAYQKKHPEAKITVVPSLGSSGGIAALTQGALDLAISTRPLTAVEQGEGARAAEYARSPFLFAAHRNVSKTGVTTDELIRIYHHEILRWPDGTRIRLVLRPEYDTVTTLLKQISPAMDRAVQRAQARPGMVIAVTDLDAGDAIAIMPGALAGTTLTEILAEGRKVNMLSYNGVKPTLENLSNGSYPLVKRFYLVTTAKASAQVQQFAAFVRSVKGRQILANSGNLTRYVKPRGPES